MKLYAKIYVYENIYFIEYIFLIRVLKILWFQKNKKKTFTQEKTTSTIIWLKNFLLELKEKNVMS